MFSTSNQFFYKSKIYIYNEKCVGCAYCRLICKFCGIDIQFGIAYLTDKCNSCGKCLEVCPVKAIYTINDEK